MSHEIPVLRELVLIAGAGLVVLLVFERLRIPAIIGFIVTGALIGPGGLGLVGDIELVRTLAEFGVVLLLFTVGLEFSLADLRRIGRVALLGGAIQVALTIAAVAAILVLAGLHPARALFFGMLVSLSSTAVVLKLLTDRLELIAPHGRLATGVLIFQDLAAIGFLLVTPFLGRWQRGSVTAPGDLGIGAVIGPVAWIFAAALGLIVAQRVIPWLIGRVSRTGSREVFLLGVVVVALGAAYLTSRAGASLALGAFLAGLMLGESELRTQVAAEVLPFRDILASVFFVAVGMSLEPRALVSEPLLVGASTAGLVVIKLLAAVVALRLIRAPWRVAVAAGLTLAQIGEFSFVLAQTGDAHGLLGDTGGQAFTAGAVFSLILTPILVARAPDWSLALHLRLPERAAIDDGSGEPAEAPHSRLISDHVVVAGAGLNGRNVARVLRTVRLRHVIVDLNPANVEPLQLEGSEAVVGDIAHPLIQGRVGVPRARVLVLAISDPAVTRHACRVARGLSSDLFIIVRTRHVSEIDELYALGANQVIPEEFETSIEIFTAVLREFHIPTNIIEAQITLLRQERYSLLRGRKLPGSVVEQLDSILKEGTTDTFLLLQHSPAVGKSLEELDLLGEGARVVAVVRGTVAHTQFDPDFRLRVGDTLVLTGAHVEIERAFERLS